MYSLNLAEDGRILSVCECIKGREYDNVVDSFPEGNVAEYRYVDGMYIHDPEPETEPEATEPATEPATDELLDILLGAGGGSND